ncbi:hypothetical protein B0T16DRAFT_453359 [Cercophora newfieldiana]|uniref:Uncharacterized protein n=1 Tax=Cercophora newfieldiana TaxID=92897 RepID=A0AA39YST3_9PEZI|nr:hypothetical protein B0T16DRAFT_453359 [Cercophora newfieldiana]
MPPPLLPRAGSGSRISAAGDAINGGVGLAGSVGVPLAIGITILLLLIIIVAVIIQREKNKAEAESNDDEQQKPLDSDWDTEQDRVDSPRLARGSNEGMREGRDLRGAMEEIAREDRRREDMSQRQRDWVVQPLSPLPAVAVRGRE